MGKRKAKAKSRRKKRPAPVERRHKITDALAGLLREQAAEYDARSEAAYHEFARMIRHKFKGVGHEDLLFAVRCVVPEEVVLKADDGHAKWYSGIIAARFDFEAEREPLTDRHIREAVEILSAAVDRLERRREGYADAEA